MLIKTVRSGASALLARQPAHVETLACYHQLSLLGVHLVSRLSIDANQADYNDLPCYLNASHQRVAIDMWPSTPVERSLVRIAGASVIGDECIVLSDGSYLLEPLWHISILSSHPAYNYRLYQRGSRRLRGSYFLVPLYWFANYYHWNAQVLPRLHGVVSSLPHDCRFIIPESAQPWQVRSLIALGINEDNICKKPTRQLWKLEILYYASPCAHSGGHSAASLCWLRSALAPNVSLLHEPGTHEYIYITRGDSKRRILNEEVYLARLESLGFMIIDPSRLSYEDQIKVFSSAKVICAPHGAGLVNMIWARAGCHVFEIFSPATVDRGCFWDLSQNLGHSYTCFLGESVDASDSDGDCDYLVNPDDLVECVASILKA